MLKSLPFHCRITEQTLTWSLVALSVVAMATGHVMQLPFHPDNTGNPWHIDFVKTIFAMNIGRYMFMITESLFAKRKRSKNKFRADLIHHVVTLFCYVVFLESGQNLLLGLVGVVIETTNIFDEVGQVCKHREKTGTVFYRRLVTASCVFHVTFRGVIPTVFLVLAMFQQSPFVMDTATLMVFFLSMIFFSVINVWLILASVQRFFKYRANKGPVDCVQSVNELHTVEDRSPYRRTPNGAPGKCLLLAKNNLGYLRPYENKNIAFQKNAITNNIDNRKDTAKEVIRLQIDPYSYFKEQNQLNNKKHCNEQVHVHRESEVSVFTDNTSIKQDAEITLSRDYLISNSVHINRHNSLSAIGAPTESSGELESATEIAEPLTNTIIRHTVLRECSYGNNGCVCSHFPAASGSSELRMSGSSTDSSGSDVLLLTAPHVIRATGRSLSASADLFRADEERVRNSRSLSVEQLSNILL